MRLNGVPAFAVMLTGVMLSVGVTGPALGADQHAEIKVQIASSSSGGSLYALGSAWSQLINQNSEWVRATPVATGGGTENLRLLGAGEVEFATGLGPESVEAYRVSGAFKGRPQFEKIRAIWGYTYGGWQFVVLGDSPIRSFQDFKGNRISVGAPGSSGARYVTEILAAHGLEAGEDFKRETLTGASGASALGDGNLDVFAFGAPIPVSYVSDLASSRPVRLVPVDAATARAYVEKTPGFFLEEFRADGYPNQANEAPALGVWWKQYWMSRSDVDADVVYEATKALFENIDTFRQAHSSARPVGLENAIAEIRIPLHAGAVRYYREKGLAIPDDLVPQEAR